MIDVGTRSGATAHFASTKALHKEVGHILILFLQTFVADEHVVFSLSPSEQSLDMLRVSNCRDFALSQQKDGNQ
jgi:hypothetical protein